MDLKALTLSPSGEYICRIDLNLYNSSRCEELATQSAKGRHLRINSPIPHDNAIQVCLCEDDYVAWLSLAELSHLQPAPTPYQAKVLSREEIEQHLGEVIAFTKTAMAYPNYYLWGGTVAPNYDCSGLMQAAFAASGIWIPRDSYQQEAFTQSISREQLLPGDLIFFGHEKVNHVALYLGDGYYIHSSGKEMGRNGIGIDQLSETGDEISRNYYHKLWGYGRVMSSYCPQDKSPDLIFLASKGGL